VAIGEIKLDTAGLKDTRLENGVYFYFIPVKKQRICAAAIGTYFGWHKLSDVSSFKSTQVQLS